MAEREPYLSVIVTSRNDDHGGTLLRRMQTFTNCFVNQCRRHGLHAELIVVEWNPPADRPPLAEALRWPAEPSPCRVRFLEVPPELHARFRHAEALPLFQMIAKNVGLRRARGRFLLCTNIDILFSDELMDYLVREQLRPGVMYRIDRTDVDTHVPVDAPVPEQLAYCASHQLRNNARLGIIKLTPDGRPDYGPVLEADGVTLGEGWCGLDGWGLEPPHTWATPGAEVWVRAAAPGALLALDVQPGASVRGRPFTLRVTDAAGALVARGRVDGQRVVLRLPLREDEPRLFRLDAEEAPVPLTQDARVLLFRVFRFCWEPAMPAPGAAAKGALNLGTREVGFLEPDDLVPADGGVRFGRNWFGVCRTAGDPHRWAGPDACLVVEPRPGPDRVLVLEVEPGPGVGWRPFDLHVLDEDGRPLARARVADRQEVALALPVPEAGKARAFALRAEGGGRPGPGDAVLDFRLFAGRWERTLGAPAGPGGHVNAVVRYRGTLAQDDVVGPETGVRFGQNWSDVSSGPEGRHRWARPGAVLVVGPRPGPDRVLVLDVQPGWGVGGKPFLLRVHDEADRLVAQARVAGRDELALALPVAAAGPPQAYRLEAVGGGRPAPNGDRLDFRLFGCRWQDSLAPAGADAEGLLNAAVRPRGSLREDDVAPADGAVRFGRNWRDLRRGEDGAHRWASDDAVLVVEAPDRPDSVLFLDVQPGPGVGWRPFVLRLLDEGGRAVDQVRVVGRQAVALALPPSSGRRAYRLQVGGGRPEPAEPDLAFRVFRCRLGSQGRWERRALRAGGHLLRLSSVRRLLGLARAFGRRMLAGNGGADAARTPGGAGAGPGPVAACGPEFTPAPPVPDRSRLSPPLLHTMACGDFTLLAREHWFELRGYPEWHIFSLHIDSMFCYTAHAAGLREVVLGPPLRAYHIEHGIGTGATPEGIQLLLQRIRAKGIPCLEYGEILDWAVAMERAGRATLFNDETWGLAGEQLRETVIGPAGAAVVADKPLAA